MSKRTIPRPHQKPGTQRYQVWSYVRNAGRAVTAAEVEAGLPRHKKGTIGSALSEFSDRGCMTKIVGTPNRYEVTAEQAKYMLENTMKSTPDIMALLVQTAPTSNQVHSFDGTLVFNVSAAPITPPWRKANGDHARAVFRGELADGTFVYRYRSGGVKTNSMALGIDTRSPSLVEAWFTEAEYATFQRFLAARASPPPVSAPQVNSAPAYTDGELDALAENVKARLLAREQYRSARTLLSQISSTDELLVNATRTVMERLHKAAYGR